MLARADALVSWVLDPILIPVPDGMDQICVLPTQNRLALWSFQVCASDLSIVAWVLRKLLSWLKMQPMYISVLRPQDIPQQMMDKN